jgi:pyruvate ferredoxin oxidoreductase gamma subunit
MKEIKILGRGGQGVVSASAVLASALFKDGYFSQAFPMYGVERAGGPARAFVRVDTKPIERYDQVYAPFIMVVIDPSTLKEEIESELETAGFMLVNTTKSEKELRKELNLKQTCVLRTIDATKIAMTVIGKPFANIPMIGALAGATGIVSLKALDAAIEETWQDKGPKVVKMNQDAVKKGYELLSKEKHLVKI